MIKLTIGGFFGQFRPLATMLLVREQHPEWFRPQVVFHSTFDSWPNVVWNGGRFRFDMPYPVTAMQTDLDFFNRRGIGLRFTYSNLLLGPQHVGDTLGNLTLELAHREINGVIVANPHLEAHIRRHYPRYQIIGSCTTDQLSSSALAARAQEVDILVLPPDLNHKHKLIRKLGPERLEVLVNERCRPGCPDRKQHYRDISRSILRYEVHKQKDSMSALPQDCVFRPGTAASEERKACGGREPLRLDFAQVLELHEQHCVQYFKLGGRDLATHVFLHDLAEYLVLDQHQLAFLRLMQDHLFSGAYKQLMARA